LAHIRSGNRPPVGSASAPAAETVMSAWVMSAWVMSAWVMRGWVQRFGELMTDDQWPVTQSSYGRRVISRLWHCACVKIWAGGSIVCCIVCEAACAGVSFRVAPPTPPRSGVPVRPASPPPPAEILQSSSSSCRPNR
jgi:hypothetical protein